MGYLGMGWSTACYVGVNHRLPTTRYDPQGRALQSWQTVLLPYVIRGGLTSAKIDYDRPWDDPRNSAYFRVLVTVCRAPLFRPWRGRAVTTGFR
jgi:hypothetical protein